MYTDGRFPVSFKFPFPLLFFFNMTAEQLMSIFVFFTYSEAAVLSFSAIMAQEVCLCVTAASFFIEEKCHLICFTGFIIIFTA